MSTEHHQPPKWADRFLEWYCRPELLEEIQGDIYELFDRRCLNLGSQKASRRFIWDVFRSFRLSTIRHLNINFSPDMLKSNLKIAWRQILKQKFFAAVKIGGFALGIAACILIGLFIRDELSYDTYYSEDNQIYRVISTFNDDGDILKGVHMPGPFAKALKDDYPEISQVGRLLMGELFGAGSKEIRPADKKQNSYEDGFIYFDQELLEILEIPMVEGDIKEALAQPNTIVIAKSKADKYFPNESAIGKSLILNNNEAEPMIVGGVMENWTSNMHLKANFLMTLTEVEFYPGEQENWGANNYHTYITLHPENNAEDLEQKLLNIIDKYVIPSQEARGMSDAREVAKRLTFELQPINEIHLHSSDIMDQMTHGDIRFVWLFGSIALFILLIACINFINLSTAKSANRAKEVGLRKVVGSFKGQLINQFLTESVLFSSLAFAIGMILAYFTLPYFNYLADKNLAFPILEWWFIPSLVVSAIFIGILAGIYPSFYLSSFQPSKVLKGRLSIGSKSKATRNGLVIFQFTTSIILIISTLVIYQQMNFMLNKKLGFQKDQVITLQGANTLGDKVALLKQELVKLPEVHSASVSDYLPIEGTMRNGNSFWKEGKVQEEPPVFGQMWRIDHDYIKTMGMTVTEGRDFSIDMPTDSQAVIINQAMVEELGLENPIGQRITNSGFIAEVIGVIEDFHFQTMKSDIEPLCLGIGNDPAAVSLKIDAKDMSTALSSITSVWDKLSPNQPIRFDYMDESFANMYADIQRMGRIFFSFAFLAIIIACLGLFALASFIAEQRSKEIGIRKVLGASVQTILALLTKNFLLLIFISLIIAVPIAWYAMNKWLQDFAYSIDIKWEIFFLSGLIVFLIAVLTISFQAIKTAMLNPVDSLRNE